ncbi:oxidoreductase [Xylariaceae sp. FL1272]|nr:oxidoreductase [Xylariaceae sp. FL1272]
MSPDSFDFVIVGGGTASIVLASRLAEFADQSVLVLEAGADHTDDPRIKTPALYTTLFDTEIDWRFKTAPQPTLNRRSISLHQGKTLGGSSCMNAQIYAPPTQAVLDAWVELGNPGWGWSTMSTYYTKAFSPPRVPEDVKPSLGIQHWPFLHSTSCGPVRLSYPGNHSHPVRRLWAETFQQKGYLAIEDPWLRASVGAFSNLASVDPDSKERSHAANSYLNASIHRPNLRIVLGAQVEKVLFEFDHGQYRAVGVQYWHDNVVKRVTAHKEIILAAGALQSPKILELSGIGNPSLLNRHDIEIVKDLPGVGENLQDHLVCDVSFAAVDELETLDSLARQDRHAFEDAMFKYMQHHEGPLTSAGTMTYAYLPMVDAVSGAGREDMMKLINKNRPEAAVIGETARAARYYDIAESMLLDPVQASGAFLTAIGQNPIAADPTGKPSPPLPGNYFTIAAILAQPLSRGTVHIASKDYTDQPEIDPRYLSNPVDIEVFLQHIMYIRSIASSPPLNTILKQPLQGSTPLAHYTDLASAKRYMEARTISMWHPAGTCSMLPEELGGVVDPRLRVYGVNNLRVVDASVVPLLPPGNLQSTVYAVAERAADLIKAAHGLQ